MHEELRRSSSVGTKKGIINFSKAILSGSSFSLAALKNMCADLLNSDLNYLAAVLFFQDIGVISIHDEKENLTEFGESLRTLQSEEIKLRLAEKTFDNLIKDEIIDINYIRYNSEKQKIILLRSAFPFSHAIYRNFLLCLDSIEETQEGWFVPTHFERQFEELISKRRVTVTQQELLKRLEKQQEDGLKAEEFVLEYENNRLKGSCLYAKQISQIDVSAGYDIVSYKSGSSTHYDRFIEVKSFRGTPHFYWSRNEREVAKINQEKYCIYLVEMEKIEEDEAKYEPIIIENPDATITEAEWLIRPESFLITKI